MKEVLAVVRMNKINATKRALADAGISSITARKVMGRGKGKVDYLLLQGAQAGHEEAISQLGPGPKLIPKRMLTIVLPDQHGSPGGADDSGCQPDRVVPATARYLCSRSVDTVRVRHGRSWRPGARRHCTVGRAAGRCG